jgi:hypothetical protein
MKSSLYVIPFLAVILPALACGSGRSTPSPGAATDEPTPFEVCTRTVRPLTDEPLTGSAFQAADDDLSALIDLAEAGDVNGAQVAFFEPHNLTHNVDGPLRQVDEALAIRLCNEVVTMERELVGNRDPTVMAEQARKIRDLLTAIAAALDVEPE